MTKDSKDKATASATAGDRIAKVIAAQASPVDVTLSG